MKINKNSKKRSKIPTFFGLIAIAVVLVTAYGVMAYAQSWWPFSSYTPAQDNSIYYGPPTDHELEHNQDAKKDAYESKTDEQEPETQDLKSVEVGISFADVMGDNVEIRAFIPGVVEGDGTCYATLTHQGVNVSESSKAFIDSSTSQCRPIKIPLNKFQMGGQWDLTITYKSSKSQGKSEIIEVEIPS